MKTLPINIRQETPADYRAVEVLTREAFWNVYRPGCFEHYVIHRYRSRTDFVPELNLIASIGDKVVGHIMYARAEIRADNGTVVPILTFGPVSVSPEYQKAGIGSKLIRSSMEKAREMGAGAIALTGALDFYQSFGFVTGSSLDIHYAYEPLDEEVPYFLICELKPGFLANISGTYKDPEGYVVDENDVDEFDADFPPKEKKKLPGQLGA